MKTCSKYILTVCSFSVDMPQLYVLIIPLIICYVNNTGSYISPSLIIYTYMYETNGITSTLLLASLLNYHIVIYP